MKSLSAEILGFNLTESWKEHYQEFPTDYPDLFSAGPIKPVTWFVRLVWQLEDEWRRVVLVWKLITHQVSPWDAEE